MASDDARHSTLASLAALGSIAAASSCCWPLLPFLFAAGAAGSSAWLMKARPFLLAFSAVCVVYGFYKVARAKQCHGKRPLARTLLLCFSAVVVLVSILFPELMANLLAGPA